MIFITLTRFTLAIFFKLLLKAIGFGPLGPIAGKMMIFFGRTVKA